MALETYIPPESERHGSTESERHALGTYAPPSCAAGFFVASNYGDAPAFTFSGGVTSAISFNFGDYWWVQMGLSIVNSTTWAVTINGTFSVGDFPNFSYDVNGNINGVYCGINYFYGTHNLFASIMAIGQYPGGAPIIGIVAWHKWVSGNDDAACFAPASNYVLVNQATGQSFFTSTDVANCALFFWIGLTNPSSLPTSTFQPYTHGIVCVSAQTVTYP
jgi:hypothetical protein